MTVEIRKLDQRSAHVSDAAINGLRGSVAGSVALPGEPGYDEARTLWNAMVDRRPALVVRAANAADVVAAVRFARDHDLLLGVRSGGHQIAGLAVADGAMLLDLSQMRAVSVDPEARTARVEPGATLAEVDAATQAHGLAVPMGINSTTGIAGLTLGGGFGWISRKLGMTIDNLRAAEVVTADGETAARQRQREPRPLLGDPRRRRQLRRRHRLRVRPAPGRPGGDRRADRASVRRRAAAAARLRTGWPRRRRTG